MPNTRLTPIDARLIMAAIDTAFDTASVSEIMGDEISTAIDKLQALADQVVTLSCSRDDCDEEVSESASGGLLPIKNFEGWHCSSDTGWLCPSHAPEEKEIVW